MNPSNKKRVPNRNKGPEMIRYTSHPSGSQKSTIYKMPSRMNRTPPIHSQRQAIANASKNIAVGIRCINNAQMDSQKLYPSMKTSNANKLIKMAKRRPNTLGVQYRTFLTVSFTGILSFNLSGGLTQLLV
jgi:hypothetical protein